MYQPKKKRIPILHELLQYERGRNTSQIILGDQHYSNIKPPKQLQEKTNYRQILFKNIDANILNKILVNVKQKYINKDAMDDQVEETRKRIPDLTSSIQHCTGDSTQCN